MSEGRAWRVLAAVALLVWVAGAWWSLRSLRALRAEAERAPSRAAVLAEMRALAEQGAVYAQVRERARAMAQGGEFAELNATVAAKLPGSRVDDTRARREPLGDGWERREQDLVFDETAIAAVMGLVDDLESRNPPWRLTAVEIRASAHTPGVGQVALTVMALQRGE